jgi:hypothetical protein
MFQLFNNSTARRNPHKFYHDRQIHQLSREDRVKIARGIHAVETAVHGQIGYGQHASFSQILATLEHHKDVLIGVAYDKPEYAIGGPYTGYIMGYEIDPDEGEFDDEFEAIEDATGLTFEDLQKFSPSGKIFLLEDQARLPGDQYKAEFRALLAEFLGYLRDNKVVFLGEARESTTYAYFKSGRYGEMEFFYEGLHRDYFGPGDHMYDVVARWK